ncbi:MAG TPA: amino acid permease C-terminal domain-containing protein, partial [Methylomirabilota bacterium]|nr:amino acid permease C-terminal domain-containing protein [Methylomirabilota bacterium]
KVPFYPVAPILSVGFCLFLIYGLPAHTFLLFAVWLTVALVVYFTYSIRNSQLSPERTRSGQAAGR